MARDPALYEYVSRRIDTYVSVPDFVAALIRLAEGLEEASVQAENDRWDGTLVFVTGYRKLRPAEVREKRKQLQVEKEAAEEREKEQLRRLLDKHGAP